MPRSLSIALVLVLRSGWHRHPAPPHKQHRMLHSSPSSTNSYFAVAATGGMHAPSELGGEFKQVSPSESSSAAQLPFIQELTLFSSLKPTRRASVRSWSRWPATNRPPVPAAQVLEAAGDAGTVQVTGLGTPNRCVPK